MSRAQLGTVIDLIAGKPKTGKRYISQRKPIQKMKKKPGGL